MWKMEPMSSWPEEHASSRQDLFKYIEAKLERNIVFAWRGMSRSEWKLVPSFDRYLERNASGATYEMCLSMELGIIEQFRALAMPYAFGTEKQFLGGPSRWLTLSLGQHSGLPTRLLDWTTSPWVGAWFACHENSPTDGALWWFDSKNLEHEVGEHWDRYQVPYKENGPEVKGLNEQQRRAMNRDERDLEATAFAPSGHSWISKLYLTFPSPRMEIQHAFHTVCGRLQVPHDVAIDELSNRSTNGPIPRGRITIAANAKIEITRYLATMNIHARGLMYPGVDNVARQLQLSTPPTPIAL